LLAASNAAMLKGAAAPSTLILIAALKSPRSSRYTRVRKMAEGYRRDLMAGQNVYVEVWCEAAGMLPQLAHVAGRFSIRCYSSSGFDSLTAKKHLADRICDIGKPAVILHLGDFDPSGVAVFDVIAEDVGAFVMADRPHGLVTVQFERIALTGGQVEQFQLDTAPPKATDSRTSRWSGGTCQLEALPPDEIARLLSAAIARHVDLDLMHEHALAGRIERRELVRGLLPNYS
jgi:hypothetical protein